MKPQLFLQHVIRPGLAVLADATALRVQSPEAEVMLLAMATQESALRHRQQVNGPARGFWQFERMGGLNGILGHHRTAAPLRSLCAALALPADLDGLWAALPFCDLLQAGAARLLLWSDMQPLPKIGAKDVAWDTYIRIWRPGKPSRLRWDAAYDGAVEVCREGAALDVSEPTDPAEIIAHIEHSLTALRRAIA